jgi:hypothetical protein
MRQRFWRGRLSTALAVTLAVIGAAAAVGAVQASGGDNGENGNNGNGHTPITICHWVPAHGGSYITITIDENGLHGHGGHENDIIPAPESGCPGAAGETAVPTKTIEVTRTVAVGTQTSVPATNTPSAATNTPQATGTVSGGGGGPNLTPSATNTTIATATGTPGGGAGAATSTPESAAATATATSEGVAQTQGGGVLSEQVTPLAGGAEALPSAGSGSSGNGMQDVYGLAALAFAAMAGAGMLVLGRRMYR